MNPVSSFLSKHRPGLAALLCLAWMGAPLAEAQGAALHSPYRIPATVKDQKKAGKDEDRCDNPPAPVLSLATGSMYRQDDPSRSTRDPQAYKRYQAAIRPVRDYAKDVAKFANNYVRSKARNTGFAECALDWLYGWAEKDALAKLETKQAYFNQGQTIASFALAYLQVRDNPYLDPRKKAAVEAWLARMAGKVRDHMNMNDAKHLNSARANHRYWAGLGVAAAGVAANDPALLGWGIDSARIGIREIASDGTLPREMKRAKKARDYHIFSVAPLVMTAELAMANGVDLYAENGGALHKLVQRVLAAYDDPSFFEKRTGEEQVPYPDGEDSIPASRLGWLEPYHARFPSEAAEDILDDKRPVAATPLGGNTTLLYTGKSD